MDKRFKAAKKFNPRSPHGERQRSPNIYLVRVEISIHAPRTGSDDMGSKKICVTG